VVTDRKRLLDLAADPRTPPEGLRVFRRAIGSSAPPTWSDREYGILIQALVRNVTTPPDVLAACLAADCTGSFQVTIAAHPNATPELLGETLRIAASDQPYNVRINHLVSAVLSHPAVTPAIAQEAVQNAATHKSNTMFYAPIFNRLLRWHPFLTA